MGKLGKIIFKNTITNYLVLGWRLVTAVFLTRFLYLNLGHDFYGFWSLLWSIFGYSLLLDFGFGQSVQKYTAEASVTGDMKRFNRLISTVVFSYCLMSVIIVIGTFCCLPFLATLIKLPPGQELTYFQNVFLFFGIGVALVFPTGVFPEILIGLKRADIKNYIMFANITLNVAGIYLLLKSGHSVLALGIFSACLNLATNLIILCFVHRLINGFKLSFKHLSLNEVKEIANFSFFAYLITFANMIIMRTDRIVLGVMKGLEAVTIYQVGTRISELMEKLTVQFQENLSPVAAEVYKSGDHERLKWILLRSNRIVAFITTGAFTVLILLAEQILLIWLKVQNKNATQIALIMLCSVYVLVMFRSASARFLLMAGQHKKLATVAVLESIINIVLSIILVHHIGVTGVAIGTLIPGTFFSVVVIFPLACKLSEISVFTYVKKVYIPIFLTAIPTALFLYYLTQKIPLANWTLIKLAVFGGLAGCIYAISGYIFFFNNDEKQKFYSLIPGGKNK